MKITEYGLRRIIRNVIRENMSYHLEDIKSLKDKIRNIMFKLEQDLKNCESHKRLRTLNMAISRMSDEWNESGGKYVGYFVDECEIGQDLNRIQIMLYKNPVMSNELLMRELDHAKGVIDSCEFLELRGMM